MCPPSILHVSWQLHVRYRHGDLQRMLPKIHKKWSWTSTMFPVICRVHSPKETKKGEKRKQKRRRKKYFVALTMVQSLGRVSLDSATSSPERSSPRWKWHPIQQIVKELGQLGANSAVTRPNRPSHETTRLDSADSTESRPGHALATAYLSRLQPSDIKEHPLDSHIFLCDSINPLVYFTSFLRRGTGNWW